MAEADVRPGRIVRAVERLLSDAAPVRPLRALRQGRNHASWVLDSRLGRLVGKLTLARSGVVVDRLVEHRRAWRHGVPVPRLLVFDQSCPELDGQMLAVFEYLVGRDAEEMAPSLPDVVLRDVIHATGTALARLHQVPVARFGTPATGLGAGPDMWADVVAGRAELLRAVYGKAPGCDGRSGLLFSGLALLRDLVGHVSPVVRPALTHLDIYFPNILLDERGRFRALLDLEHIRRVDPIMDFVKPAMWVFGGRPEWARAFVEGYQAGGGGLSLWRERLTVATGLELLSGVGYWRRVGDRAMLEDYLRRLVRWVESTGADTGWPEDMTRPAI
jgi:hypothetical protein